MLVALGSSGPAHHGAHAIHRQQLPFDAAGEAVTFPTLLPAPDYAGRPAWSNNGSAIDGFLLAGVRHMVYWKAPTFEDPSAFWLIIRTDGMAAAAWTSASDVASPELATGWTAVSPSTGVPVISITSAAAPAPPILSTEGGAAGAPPAGFVFVGDAGNNLGPAVHGGITGESVGAGTPPAGFALAAEAGINLAPAVHGGIQAESGVAGTPLAGFVFAAEAGTNLSPAVHGGIQAESGVPGTPPAGFVFAAEAGVNLAPALHGVITGESGGAGTPPAPGAMVPESSY
jgi:hypothetical protein